MLILIGRYNTPSEPSTFTCSRCAYVFRSFCETPPSYSIGIMTKRLRAEGVDDAESRRSVKNTKIDKNNFMDVLLDNDIELKDIHQKLFGDKKIVMKCLEYNIYNLQDVSSALRDDAEVIMQGLEFGGHSVSMDCIPREILSDEDVITFALKKCPHAIYSIDRQYKYYKKYALIAVQSFPSVYLCAFKSGDRRTNPRMLHDKDIILAAVGQSGYMLEQVPEEFQDDVDVVLESVKNDGISLRYASDGMKNTKKVVMEAIKNNKCAYAYASYNMKVDMESQMLACGVHILPRDIERLMNISFRFR